MLPPEAVVPATIAMAVMIRCQMCAMSKSLSSVLMSGGQVGQVVSERETDRCGDQRLTHGSIMTSSTTQAAGVLIEVKLSRIHC